MVTTNPYVYITNVTTVDNADFTADCRRALLSEVVEKWKRLPNHMQGMVLASTNTSLDLICILWPTLLKWQRDIVVRRRNISSWFLLVRWDELTLEQQSYCAIQQTQIFKQLSKKQLPKFLVHPMAEVRQLACDRYRQLGSGPPSL